MAEPRGSTMVYCQFNHKVNHGSTTWFTIPSHGEPRGSPWLNHVVEPRGSAMVNHVVQLWFTVSSTIR